MVWACVWPVILRPEFFTLLSYLGGARRHVCSAEGACLAWDVMALLHVVEVCGYRVQGLRCPCVSCTLTRILFPFSLMGVFCIC